MLTSFSMENFLSIKDRVELSMVATARDKSLPDNIMAVKLGEKEDTSAKLLKSAVIYGPNASGKTNILKAIRAFSRFVVRAVQNTGKPIPFVPFALDPACTNRPSAFEVSLIEKGTIYRYGLSADASFVHSEYLFTAGEAGERKIFERHAVAKDSAQSYDYGPSGKDLSGLERFVRPDSLMLSVGTSYNNQNCGVVWHKIAMLTSSSTLSLDMRGSCLSGASKTEKTISLLSDIAKYLGFGFSKLAVEQPSGPGRCGTMRCGEPAEAEVRFIYTDSKGKEVLLDEQTQSNGTIQFLNMLADILATGKSTGGTLWLDEIESGLHPLLCEALFQFVHALPSGNVQLICTTHNTQLLNPDLFRRDQVWLTEKNREGATDLYSLADFKGKPSGRAWDRQYLAGRFGGLPILNTARVKNLLEHFTATPEVKG
jgi:energy-coupling factor transporter ATP-binding protein EcfA2